MNGGLRTGRSCLSRRYMPTGFLLVLICSCIVVGQTEAQEVIVARETKPEASKQTTPPPEQSPSESPTPEPSKPKPRSRKSTSAEPTLEQMRMAGALAAERLDNPSPSQKNRSDQSDSEAAPTPNPVVEETPRPSKKRETPSEQPSKSHRPTSRPAKAEPVGAVRPTFMESGRSEPSTTPAPKGTNTRALVSSILCHAHALLTTNLKSDNLTTRKMCCVRHSPTYYS